MRENNTEFIDVEWFDAGTTGMHGQNIGIVLVLNEHAGFKCYIGIGNGASVTDDMEMIYKMGTKISHKLASAVWGGRMRAEWLTRHLAEYDGSYMYDGHRYAKEPTALAKIASMSQGDLKRMIETQKLARELDPLFHALKQLRQKDQR